MEIKWPEIVTNILGFLLLFFGLKRFAWGPILGLLDARREKIAKDVAGILSAPGIEEFLAKQGAEPFITTSPDAMGAVVKEEIARYTKIIKAAGIKFEP